MKKILLFLLLLAFSSLNSCKDKDKNKGVDPIQKADFFNEFNHWEIKGGDGKPSILIQDKSQLDILLVYGKKNTSGEPVTVDSIYIYNKASQASLWVKIDSKGLVTDLISRRKGFHRKISFSDYNLNSGTVSVAAIDVAQNTIELPKQVVKIDGKNLELLKLISQESNSNGRAAALSCAWKKAIAYAKLASCITTVINLPRVICTMSWVSGPGRLLAVPICYLTTRTTHVLICVEFADEIVELTYDCDRDPNEPQEPLPPLPPCLQIAIEGGSSEEWEFECEDDDNDNEETGESWGDPHLITFDGLKYDFQGWGEFVAVKSTTDNFEVQVRYTGTKGGTFSFNAGVAVQTGEDLVSKTNEGLYINNVAQSLDFSTKPLKGGATVTYDRSTGDVKIRSKWGDVVNLAGVRPKIKLDKSRKGKVVGLFGNYDGDPKNDLLLKDNKSIDISDLKEDNFSLILPYDRIYPALPTAWRITQASSLFHYKVGENTNTNTVLEYPSRSLTLSKESIESARKSCTGRGVTKEPYLSSCIFDVATTGNSNWIDESLDAQNNSRKSSIVQLTTYSDMSYYQNVKVTVSKQQAVLEDSCLVDYVSGKVYQLKDGAKYARNIDGLFLTYCGIELYTPQTILTCGFSCGVSRTNTLIKEQKWPVYRKGAVEFLGFAKDDDPTYPGKITAEKFDQISSSDDITELFKTGANNITPNNEYTSTTIVSSTLECMPDILLGRTLRRFVTQDGKRGVIRIKNWGEKDGKYFVEFDVKIQK